MRPIRLHRSHSFFRWSPANHSSRVFKTFRWIWNSITFDCRTYGACTERYRAREPMIVARRVGNTIVTVAVHIYATIRRSRHRRQMNGVTLPSCNSSHQYFIFVRCCNNQQGAPTGVAALCQCSRSTGFEVVAPIDTVLRPFTSLYVLHEPSNPSIDAPPRSLFYHRGRSRWFIRTALNFEFLAGTR